MTKRKSEEAAGDPRLETSSAPAEAVRSGDTIVDGVVVETTLPRDATAKADRGGKKV